MAKTPDPIRITTVARSHREDVARRQRRYLISMGIRTLCFVLAVVCIGHWIMWVFIAGSFVLPYVAVVLANAGGSTDPVDLEAFDREQLPALEAPDPGAAHRP